MRVVAMMVGMLAACEGGHDRRSHDGGFDPPRVDAETPPRLVRVVWAIGLGSHEQNRLDSIATDSQGNVYASGARGAKGQEEPIAFITKRSFDTGAEVWTKDFVPVDSDAGGGGLVAIDANDNVYFAATIYQRLSVDDVTLGAVGTSPTVLVKWTPDGEMAWDRTLEDVRFGEVRAIAVDAAGRTFIAGSQRLTIDDQPDAYLIAFDTDGTKVWTKHFQAAGAGPDATSVAIASDGDVLLTGGYTQSTSFGGSLLATSVQPATFLARFDRDGDHVNSGRVGPSQPSTTSGQLVATADDRIILHAQEVQQGPQIGPSGNSSLATIRVLDDAFQHKWALSMPNRGSSSPQVRGLTVVGETIVSAAWTDFPMSGMGRMEVMTFDAASGSRSESQFGHRIAHGTSPTLVRAMTTTPQGNVVYGGIFDGFVDLGTGLFADPEGHEIFLAVTEP